MIGKLICTPNIERYGTAIYEKLDVTIFRYISKKEWINVGMVLDKAFGDGYTTNMILHEPNRIFYKIMMALPDNQYKIINTKFFGHQKIV
jgi:hypothetical protein